jgi:2',3'-cyclic-nucleotide 2'-phosphodiesterase (5'-nucleotidase family)
MTRTALFALALLAAIASGASPTWAGAPDDGIMRLSVVFTNDIHGGIDPQGATFMNREFPPPLGGGASAMTYIGRLRERAKEEGGHVLLFDQGDIFQGTPVGNYRKGEAVVEYFNHIGLDLWAVGNHDFDEGFENLQHLVSMSQMPVLSANIVHEDGAPVDGLVPYVIKEYDGIRIAVIGLTTTDTPKMAFPEHVEGVEFLPELETLKKYVREVREQGADLVFVAGHFGLPYDPVAAYREMIQAEEDAASGALEPLEGGKWGPSVMDVAHKVPGIDVIFGGHIHKGFDKAWEEPSTHTLAFQTYGRGTGLGHVDLLIDRRTRSIVGYELADYRGGLITLFEDEWWPEEGTRALIGDMVAEAEQGMDEVIGQAEVDLTRGGEGETRMGNLVCNAMLEEAAADFAFSNLGGIRDEIPAGPITPRQVFRVLPFGNRLTVLEVDGRLLKEILEYRVSDDHHGLYIAGGKVVYNKTRPDYDRLTTLEIGGEPWSPDRTYRIVTTDFLAAGNAGLYMLPNVPEERKMTTSTTDMEAVVRYIRRHASIGMTTDGRWARDDGATVDPALVEAMKGMEPLAPPTDVEEGAYD